MMLKLSYELKFDDLLPEERISYLSYSAIYYNLYNDIKNKSEILKYVFWFTTRKESCH